MILNERILRLVVTLAEELHFGRAAATLHVSQPALSGTVKGLERDLGVRLFQRNSRNVELTAAGHVLVAEARRLILENDRAVALVRASSSDLLGPLHIGYPASMNLPWLGALISRAREEPSLGADVRFISSEAANLPQELVKRTLHAAFFAGRLCHPDLPDLESVPLFREPLMVAMNAANPLAHAPFLTAAQLQDVPVVWLHRDVNPLVHANFLAQCATQAYRPNVVQEVRSFYECLQFAREGLGITFLPLSMKSSAEGASIVFSSLAEARLHVEYTLAYRRNGGSQGVERFVQFVRNQVPGRKPVPPGYPLPAIDRRLQSLRKEETIDA